MWKTAILGGLAIIALVGCSNLNPLAQVELTRGFSDRAIEVNDAYHAELNAQILKNVLRARDRQNRRYTTLSALKLTPQASAETSFSAGDVGLGNNVGDPWIMLGAERMVSSANNLELTISAEARGPDEQSVFRSPIPVDQFIYYYQQSGWPRDVVGALLIGSEKLAVRPDDTILRRIYQTNQDFYIYASGQLLTYCFIEAGVNTCPEIAGDSRGGPVTKLTQVSGSSDTAKNTDTIELGSPTSFVDGTNSAGSAVILLEPREILDVEGNDRTRDFSLLVSCRNEQLNVLFKTSAAADKIPHAVFRCSKGALGPTVCLNDACSETRETEISLFRMVWDPDMSVQELHGIYAINLNSIDDAIYTLGASLRSGGECSIGGMAICSSDKMVSLSRTEAQDVPLIALATRESLLKPGNGLIRCASHFSARVRHHGKVYFAGAPQSFEDEFDTANCRFPDRSGTALTLIAELIELRQVPAELKSSSFLITN